MEVNRKGVVVDDDRVVQECVFIKGREGGAPALVTFPELSVDEFADQFQDSNQRVCTRDYGPKNDD